MSRPNILLVMVDQLTAFALRAYGNRVCRTPRLDALAAEGTVFENAYCNFPLCAPARYGLLSGRLPSRIGAYDNACELPATVPTLPYYLASAGYHTCLVGKMHFVGPDQLHGYQERLTTDIYPADFGWTPDWGQAVPFAPSGMSMRSVVEAGPCVRSLQYDYDDEVANVAVKKVYDLARKATQRPFFLTVSFTHPHNPYVAAQRYWDLYRAEEIDMPGAASVPFEQRDAHSRRLWYLFRQDEHDLGAEDVRRARQAYYANMTYLDDQIGRILDALSAGGLAQNTIVMFTSDHGDMLGEHGLWYKYTLREHAVRIPLMVRIPGAAQTRRSSALVSHVDLLPTLMHLVEPNRCPDWIDPIDGRSFAAALSGAPNTNDTNDTVYAEFTAEGAIAPMLMVRTGPHKLIWSGSETPQLYDLDADPLEQNDLAGGAQHAARLDRLVDTMMQHWDVAALDSLVRTSQRRRRWLQELRLASGYPGWDYEPRIDASTQYVRNGSQSNPTMVKGLARYPFVPPKAPDHPRDLGRGDN